MLFEQYFLKSFSSRLAEYSNPEIEVVSKKKLNENYTMVSSILVGTEQRPEVKIDWRIYTKNPENLLIRDLIIDYFYKRSDYHFLILNINKYCG